MLVARMMYPVRTLGPGERLVIWVCGCNRRCRNCANPELQHFDIDRDIPVETLMGIIREICTDNPEIAGLTISGGEPFEQPYELAQLLASLPSQLRDVLIYSGYTLEQLQNKHIAAIEYVLAHVWVLIDGEYVDELNDGHPLRGSRNQCIHYLNPDAETSYSAYIASHSANIQNFLTEDAMFSVGIHQQGFTSDLQMRMAKKGCHHVTAGE